MEGKNGIEENKEYEFDEFWELEYGGCGLLSILNLIWIHCLVLHLVPSLLQTFSRSMPTWCYRKPIKFSFVGETVDGGWRRKSTGGSDIIDFRF